MSNKKETAVEWLINYWKKLQSQGEKMTWNEIIAITGLAKELEKQQIIDAWENGYDHGACVNEDKDKYHGIQYYNETFKK
jgi:hypothetical protein